MNKQPLKKTKQQDRLAAERKHNPQITIILSPRNGPSSWAQNVCRGTDKNGNPCKQHVQNGQEYCAPCYRYNNLPFCKGIDMDGNPCKQRAHSGHEYCASCSRYNNLPFCMGVDMDANKCRRRVTRNHMYCVHCNSLQYMANDTAGFLCYNCKNYRSCQPNRACLFCTWEFTREPLETPSVTYDQTQPLVEPAL